MKNQFDKLVRFLASGLGLGLIPVAPGTFGTLLGSAIWFLLKNHSNLFIWKITGIVTVAGIVIAHLAEKAFHEKDAQRIVIDEVAGVLCCYALVGYSTSNLVWGFVLFRLCDIAKIFPCRWAQDNLKGGLGVVGDDVIAGFQAGLILKYMPLAIVTVKGLLH